MEQVVLFEEKIFLSPKDLNYITKQNTIDKVLLKHLRTKLENRCSQHGFVIPNSLEIVSRSIGHMENGTFTGNIIFHIQTQGRVYNPANGTRITGTILKRNKMGLYIIYKDAIRILIPRDLHIGNEAFEQLEPNQTIEVEIRKSRFQIHDLFILSIGTFIKRTDTASEPTIVDTLNTSATKKMNEEKTDEENLSDFINETNEEVSGATEEDEDEEDEDEEDEDEEDEDEEDEDEEDEDEEDEDDKKNENNQVVA
jgi:DNA-directed RNA polymerase subunit E'/Rpb7